MGERRLEMLKCEKRTMRRRRQIDSNGLNATQYELAQIREAGKHNNF